MTQQIRHPEAIHLNVDHNDSYPYLRLASLFDSHRQYLHVQRDREYIAEHFPWAMDVSPESNEERLRDVVTKIASGSTIAYQIRQMYGQDIDQESMQLGEVSLHDHEPVLGTAQMSIWLPKDYSGQGIGSLAASTLAEYGFSYWSSLERIQMYIGESNVAAQRLAQKIGAHLVGEAEANEMNLWELRG